MNAVSEQAMEFIWHEIKKAEELLADLIAHHQPETMIQKQKGIIEGMKVLENGLGELE